MPGRKQLEAELRRCDEEMERCKPDMDAGELGAFFGFHDWQYEKVLISAQLDTIGVDSAAD